MTLRQRTLAVVGALALLGATLSTGLGYGDEHADTSSVTIHPGPLTAILTWESFEDQSGDAHMESQDGCLVVRVLDERGYATGWNVSVSTMDYSGPGGHLGADQLALSPGAVSLVRGNPDLTGHVTFSVVPLRTSPSLLWSVPGLSGDGQYDLPLRGTLGVPENQHGTYLYIVVVNIDGIAP